MAENYDDTMGQLAKDIVALEDGDLVLAGIYANKPGYHNKRQNLPSDDYSVKYPADKRGPKDKAAAIDITSRSAQAGNYAIIKRYSNRLYVAGQANDPRMYGWREFFGQTDNDGTVEGWDYVKNSASTSSDKSHNWHIHLSELRQFVTNKANKLALLSVLKGETLASFKARGGALVGGTSTPAPTPKPPLTHLGVDGELGPKTIKRWQQVMGTTADGKIDADDSQLIRKVQAKLKTTVDHRLVVDGDLGPKTIAALQRYLKSPVDGIISQPKSEVIKALQRRLNTGKF